MKFHEVIGVNRMLSFKEFQLYLKLAEVYGGGYLDDIDNATFNNRQNITHRDSFIKQLRMVINAYDMGILSCPLKEESGDVLRRFIELLHFQKAMFERLISIQQKRPDDSDYHRIPEGHLVQMTCGHRGQPNRVEEKRISRLLRKSGFIPMLEDIVEKNQKPTTQQEIGTEPKK